jgi:monothiol glutaredoxin
MLNLSEFATDRYDDIQEYSSQIQNHPIQNPNPNPPPPPQNPYLFDASHLLIMMNRLLHIRGNSSSSIRHLARFNGGAATGERLSGRILLRGVTSSSATTITTNNYINTTQYHPTLNGPSHCFHRRPFSSSHDDFSPQKKHNLENSEEESILTLIDTHVKSNPIMLYMKGSPSQPQCGFSATVVQILKNTGVDFASVNVLDYPEVREGVKKYAQWPTIPQLYVSGEFVGGCDVVREMEESGELKELLSKATKGVEEK